MSLYRPRYRDKDGHTVESKIYWMEFVLRGERIRKSTGESNKRKATDYEAHYRSQLLLGKIGIHIEDKEDNRTPVPKFADAMTEFLAWAGDQHNLKASTVHRYSIASVPLKNHFGNRRLTGITPADIAEYLNRRLRSKSPVGDDTIARATVNRERSCLSRLFCYFESDAIPNPFNDPKAVKDKTIPYLKEDNTVCNVLSLDEEDQYLAHCSPMLRDFAVMMVDTGMRNSEVLNLRGSDIDLQTGRVFVRWGKTASAERTVFLTERAREVVARRLDPNKRSGLLFAGGKDGKGDAPPLKLNNAHYGALKRSGVKPFRLYDLRHTFATRQALLGTDLMTLKDLLGHSGLDMLKRYVHPSDEHKANAIRRMEAARA